MSVMAFQRLAAEGEVKGEYVFPTRTKPERHVTRFVVPAGVPCGLSKVSPLDWQEYTTKRETGFERFEKYEKTKDGGFYHFRHKGWMMVVHRMYVIHREDSYEPGT